VLYYSRANIKVFVNTISSQQYILLLFILFINDFSIHRNMYQALKGFYITLACLLYNKRRKPANKYTLTLGLYSASINDIISSILAGLNTLGHSVVVDINST
jgi:hypothetical protein